MPNCTRGEMEFGRLVRCTIEANFEGGALSSDGGLMLLRQVDRRIGLSRAVAESLHDPRNQERITHGMRDLVAQRLYALCCGHEDPVSYTHLCSSAPCRRPSACCHGLPTLC